jgi:hypothetical protein
MKWLVGIGLTVLVVAARAAGAPPPLHTVAADVSSQLVTDNVRYAVFVTPAGAATVIDTRSGTRRALSLAPGCEVEDGAAGHFLLNCPAPFQTQQPYVLRAGSGSLFKVPGGPTAFDELFVTSIGRRWLAGDEEHGSTAVYIEWRTGHVVSYGEDIGTEIPRDLDTVALSPLPRGLLGTFRGYRLLRTGPGLDDFKTLVLRQRGRRQVRLAGCYPGGCTWPSLGPSAAVWTRGASVRAFVLRTGLRVRWNFGSFALAPVAQQTAHRVFFNVPIPGDPQQVHYRVDEARIPG